MRRVLCYALTLLLGACARSSGAPSEPGAATVVQVVDGDTVVVDLAGRQETLRLIGVDTSTPISIHPVRAASGDNEQMFASSTAADGLTP